MKRVSTTGHRAEITVPLALGRCPNRQSRSSTDGSERGISNMTRNKWLLLLVGSLLAAGSAIASGSTGGGGGTGGGGTGGGGTTTACAPIQSLKVVPGYYKGVVAAIWTSFSLQQCNGAYYIAEITATDLDTGLVTYVNSSYLMSATIDYDFAPFSTNFRIDFTVIDRSTGAVLDSRSVLTATPPPPPPGSTVG